MSSLGLHRACRGGSRGQCRVGGLVAFCQDKSTRLVWRPAGHVLNLSLSFCRLFSISRLEICTYGPYLGQLTSSLGRKYSSYAVSSASRSLREKNIETRLTAFLVFVEGASKLLDELVG